MKPDPTKPAEFAFGSGPAYLNGNRAWYATPGSRGANLMVDTHVSGPMLVRTMRLDGDGHLALTNSGMPEWARKPWQIPAIETSDGMYVQVPPLGDHWPIWTGSLQAESPGCYGIQVDGADLTSLVVITILPGPVPPG